MSELLLLGKESPEYHKFNYIHMGNQWARDSGALVLFYKKSTWKKRFSDQMNNLYQSHQYLKYVVQGSELANMLQSEYLNVCIEIISES
ncbi:MAG: hypothetical protein ACI870_000512 [Crocinitomicaceae bacterium]|jgi:hypothetical protein